MPLKTKKPNQTIKYLWFCLVGSYGISTTVGYLIPNPLYYIYSTYIWFGLVLVGFYGISTTVDYLMLNHIHAYISNICDLVWLSLMAYQPL